MTLQEALNICSPAQYLARKAWIENGIMMRLMSSVKAIEQLNLDLTPESLSADDWDIYEINQ